MRRLTASNSQRLYQLLAIARRVILASVVLDAESVRLVRYDLGLVMPPIYMLKDSFVLSQVAHAYQKRTESKRELYLFLFQF